jgi:hypothetical protein
VCAFTSWPLSDRVGLETMEHSDQVFLTTMDIRMKIIIVPTLSFTSASHSEATDVNITFG